MFFNVIHRNQQGNQECGILANGTDEESSCFAGNFPGKEVIIVSDRKNVSDKQENGKLIPFPIRFAETVKKQHAPKRKISEVYDDSTTVNNTGQYEDTESDEY